MREAPFGLYFLKWGLRPGEAPETQSFGGVEEVLALLSRLPGASVQPEPGDIARFPHMALEGAWLKSPAPRSSVVLSREGRAIAFEVLGAPVRCIAGPGPRELSLLARELGLEQRMGIVDAKARAWRPLDRAAAWRSPPPPAPAPEPPAPPPPPPALSRFGPFRPRWSRDLGKAGLMLEKLVLTPSTVLACGHGHLTALRRDTGEPLWTIQQGRCPHPVSTPSCVVVASDALVGVSHERGEVRWRIPCPEEASEAPVSLGGERVAVALGPGRVGVLDSSDGRVLWSREFGRSSQPRCLFHEGRLVVAMLGTGLHVLEPETGETLAHRSLHDVGMKEDGARGLQGMEAFGDSLFLRLYPGLVRLRLPTLEVEEVLRLGVFPYAFAMRRLGGLLAVAGTHEPSEKELARYRRWFQAMERRVRAEYLGHNGATVLDVHDEAAIEERVSLKAYEHGHPEAPLFLRIHEATTLRLLHELRPPLWWQLPTAVDARHWLLPLRAEAPHQKPALQLLRVDTFEAIEVPLPGTPAVPVTLVADGPEAVFLSCGPTVTACRFDGGESVAAPGRPG